MEHGSKELEGQRTPRRIWVLLLLLGCAAILVAFFCALGIWQVERRAWKLDLIERVEARINAPPVAVPPPAEWNSIDRAGFEYRRVEANGRFMAERTVFVQAVTSRGGGFWVVTPLQTAEGFTILVNRGFVSSAQRAALQNSDEPVETSVTGLLRLSEPGGGFLRSNDPAGGRWFSRDVAAISEAQGLSSVAPYFIDAEAVPDAPEGSPLGGLTVVSFNNNHLVYALTWFGLALMALAAAAYLIRDERRLRRTQR